MSATHWLPSYSPSALQEIDALCLGTGRFLRSVLVPALVGAGYHPAMIQPRGRSFLEFMQDKNNGSSSSSSSSYEVDTVERSGAISTTQVPCYGAFSLGRSTDKHAFVECLPKMNRLSILGVGVTEYGLSSKDTPVMKDLYELMHLFYTLIRDGTWLYEEINPTITVINMDNIPNNGALIQSYMQEHASDDDNMKQFLKDRIVFVNTMVDRFTSHREGNAMVPKCEPTPKKAMVILDPTGTLPSRLSEQDGVIIRTSQRDFDFDVTLKLSLCDGTHTAIAHILALTKHPNTDMLSTSDIGKKEIMMYSATLAAHQIFAAPKSNQNEANIAYQDSRHRLLHPFFGTSTFVITQNGRPTVSDLLSNHEQSFRLSFAFAHAVRLRWLTPITPGDPEATTVYRGWFDGVDPKGILEVLNKGDTANTVEYADGLLYNLKEGWYEFKCSLQDGNGRSLAGQLYNCRNKQPTACRMAIYNYMLHPNGGNLAHCFSPKTNSDVEYLVAAVSVLYSRLLAGDSVLSVLRELTTKQHGIALDTFCSDFVSTMDTLRASNFGQPLHYKRQCIPDSSALMSVPIDPDSIADVVTSEVQSVIAIDLHTHLLPPTHGPLCLWGIDELLTYVCIDQRDEKVSDWTAFTRF
jgi:hypothetical protein